MEQYIRIGAEQEAKQAVKDAKFEAKQAIKKAKVELQKALRLADTEEEKASLNADYQKLVADSNAKIEEAIKAEEQLNAKIAEQLQRPVQYDSETKKVIRLVSTRRPKKVYQITGVEDVASKNNWKAWLYLAPVLVLLVVFLIYPLINTMFIAFTDNYLYAAGTYDGLTLKNFAVILGITSMSSGAKEIFFTQYAIPNTFIIVFITVPISTLLALIISVALNSLKWFQKFLQTVFFLPYVTNAIAVGMVFSVIFDVDGVINYIFGLDNYAWIYGADRSVAMIPLCIYIVWSSIPFKILVFLSGLQGIDKQYYQAAQIDSCSHMKVLWKITVPLLSPQILYIVITSFIGAFKEYTSIVGLFGGPGTFGDSGDPNMYTIVYYIYENLQENTSLAAAAAVFLFVIILIFTFFQMWISKKRVHY